MLRRATTTGEASFITMKGVPKTAAEVRATYRAILAAAKVGTHKSMYSVHIAHVGGYARVYVYLTRSMCHVRVYVTRCRCFRAKTELASSTKSEENSGPAKVRDGMACALFMASHHAAVNGHDIINSRNSLHHHASLSYCPLMLVVYIEHTHTHISMQM